MTTTNTLITAALARGLRDKLPAEWFGNRTVCPKCKQRSTVMTTWEGGVYWCRECDGERGIGKRVPLSHFSEAECYIGPNLTREDKLHELLRFADAIALFNADVLYHYDKDEHWFHAHIQTGDLDGIVDYHTGSGPTRTTAVLAACAAALGINEGATQ